MKTAGDIKISVSRSRRVWISISDTYTRFNNMYFAASTLTTSHFRHDASTVRHREAATEFDPGSLFPVAFQRSERTRARARLYVHLARIVRRMHIGSCSGGDLYVRPPKA